MPHSGLPVASDIRSCYWYHKNAVGHAAASDVQTDITWHGDRAAHFVNNIIQVCQKPYQFSCWNRSDPNFKKLQVVDEKDLYFSTAMRIARRALIGVLPDMTKGATHYHADGVLPFWARGETPSVKIGNHIFYRIAER